MDCKVKGITVLSNYDYFSSSAFIDLKARTASGAVWTLSGQAARFITTLLSTAFLARVLKPSDFGLVAMGSVVIGLCSMIKEMGLVISSIQARTLSRETATNLHWLNVFIGLGLTLVVYLISPAVAWVYGDARLIPISASLGLIFCMNGFSSQHNALMRRHLRLKRVMAAEYAGIVTGSLAAITYAVYSPTYWALVIQFLVSQGATSVYRLTVAGWVPGRPIRSESIWKHVKFGGRMTAADLCVYISRNGDNFLVGKFLGAETLGLYSKAYQLLLLPLTQINAPLTTVFIPALSRLQDEPVRFREWYLKGLKSVAMMTTPIVFGLLFLAEEVVFLILGPQWENCVLLFRCLAPAALVSATNISIGWVYIPLGRARELLQWSLFFCIVSLLMVIVGLSRGALGVAVSISLTYLLLQLPGIAYCYRGTSLKVSDYISSVLPPILVGVLSVGAGWASLQFVSESPVVRLIVGGGVFSIAVISGYLILPSIRKNLFETFYLMRGRCPDARAKIRP